ncbi:WD40/YVTN/BNR-like repeat-containing protein [Alkalihalobacillus sp. 1P02AB]|uniref:WD40/YVTN/BNR-like repeat-containing protein n=1 Tax=Alkalihalobacillus sp. 1P02AB TaxID=3132260 RepID=UPI0039A62EFD
MKRWILSVSLLMVVSLMIATVFFQRLEPVIPRQQALLNQVENQDDAEEQEDSELILYPVTNDPISYSLQYDALHVTFNSGNDWVEVPIEKDMLFQGEYTGDKQRLIENSFLLTEAQTAFIFSEGEAGSKDVFIMRTLDQGDTWEEIGVGGPYPSLRFRKIDFIDEHFGYVIVTGERTMSFEATFVFITKDGGDHWEGTNLPDTARLIVDGGFVDESTGFLSFGGFNPEEPALYVTQDGGETWMEAMIAVPEEFKEIFIVAETPKKEDDHLVILLNQGPNGDYIGGKVKGKFISLDDGLTWEFAQEVELNETN